MSKVCTRRTCYYFGTQTDTCDYYLMNGVGHRRGCPPGSQCTRYVNREEREPKKIALPKTSKQASAFIDRPKVNGRRERIDMMDVLDQRMKLYRYGLSDAQIAKIEGSRRNTVGNWRRRRRLPPNTGKEAEA